MKIMVKCTFSKENMTRMISEQKLPSQVLFYPIYKEIKKLI